MSEKSLQESVQAQFGNVAENYTTSAVHAGGEDLQQLIKQAELTGAERVLDAGTGAGHAAFAAAPHANEVVAYDFTAQMLEQVRHNADERGLTNIKTELGDVAQLPFEDQSFDRVISRYSAHHWPRPAAALAEFKRVLKPGGLFVLADVVAPDDPTTDSFVQTLELLRDPSHVRDFSVAQWLAYFNGAGFSPELVFEWRVRLTFDKWVARMATPDQNVAMLKTLFAGAPAEVRSRLEIDADNNFALHGAVIKGA